MLAGMPLMRRDILYCPVIAFGVEAVNKGSNQAFQLMEYKDVLEAQPVVFECPEKGFDPSVVRGCLISGKQLRDAQVLEELGHRFGLHLRSVI